MAEREEVIEFLNKQLEKLKTEEHVEELMKAGRIDELKQIAEKTDVLLVQNFVEEELTLDLSEEEISSEFCYEIIIYLWASGLEDWQLFEEDEVFINILYKKEEELATGVAILMEGNNIYACSMEEICGVKH